MEDSSYAVEVAGSMDLGNGFTVFAGVPSKMLTQVTMNYQCSMRLTKLAHGCSLLKLTLLKMSS